ncbi:MAG: hypothetical protein K6C97_00305 [Treponema sp.]|nr:hypothetical protein [Treponema sp.]
MNLKRITIRKIINRINYKIDNGNFRKDKLLKIMENDQLDKQSLNFNRKHLYQILKYAYKNVPFYKQNYKELAKLNSQNVYQIVKTLPLLSKEIILSQKENIYKKNYKKENYGWMNTGGSTGEPLSFPTSYNYEDYHQKALYEYITKKPYKNNLDKDGALISFDGTAIPQELKNKNEYWVKSSTGIYGSYNFSSFELNKETYKLYLNKLNEIQPKFFRGYTSTICDLAKYILNERVEIKFTLQGVYLTSENINNDDVELLNTVFKCPVFGQYGHSEISVFAWTKANSLTYHFSPFYGYTEILDENGNDVEEGQIGEIVVTGFSNKPLPFIRYKTGDLAIKGKDSLPIPMVFTAQQLMGRTTDYLYDKNGKKVYCIGPIFGAHLHAFENIHSWQLEQNENGKIDVLINKLPAFSKDDENEIAKLFLNMNIDSNIIYTKEFKLSKRGKRKFILQNVK